MTKRFVLVLIVLAAIAAAGTVAKLGVYHITLSKPIAVGSTLLKAGDYKLAVGDSKVTMTAMDGGSPVEAPVKTESAPTKFATTVVTYETNNSQSVISEIDLGGTKTKLMFMH